MGDGIRRLADAVATGSVRRKRPAKVNRMLSLTEPQFTRFQAYCKAKHIFTSEVVDALIAVFMHESDAEVRATLGEPDPAQAQLSDGDDDAS